jgi:transposase
MSAGTIRPVVHLALELSVTSWVIAYRLPWSDKVRLQRVPAGDSAALLALVSDLREKAAARMGSDVTLASCFEAGRDGFWLHRLLTDNGVVNHVVEPTSILVTRGARRAKTDRLELRHYISRSGRRDVRKLYGLRVFGELNDRERRHSSRAMCSGSMFTPAHHEASSP